MSGRRKLEVLVLAVNTMGLVLYLFWLGFRSSRIFYTQDGVLYLLPCVPFFFVYVFVFYHKGRIAQNLSSDEVRSAGPPILPGAEEKRGTKREGPRPRGPEAGLGNSP